MTPYELYFKRVNRNPSFYYDLFLDKESLSNKEDYLSLKPFLDEEKLRKEDKEMQQKKNAFKNEYKQGDKIYVKHIKRVGESHSFENRYDGPFEVISTKSPFSITYMKDNKQYNAHIRNTKIHTD